ncbi:coiled-coil domain-containing protein 93 [Populus alba x Populus x berolinensis]|nr:coiled-coil domain-containing protein 93 [Populus alba x Populus x berolinensis]
MQQQHDDDTNKVTRFEEEELQSARASVETLTANLDNLNQRKADVLNNLEQLRERINKEGDATYTGVQKLVPLLKSLKDLESQEAVLQSDYDVKRTELEAEVCNLEEKIAAGMDSEARLRAVMSDAITTTNGCTKLIASMEGIVKGSQQRLQKVELGLQEEQKVSDALKKRYAAAMAEQRRCYSLLKAFQEECAKNERLRGQTSV